MIHTRVCSNNAKCSVHTRRNCRGLRETLLWIRILVCFVVAALVCAGGVGMAKLGTKAGRRWWNEVRGGICTPRCPFLGWVYVRGSAAAASAPWVDTVFRASRVDGEESGTYFWATHTARHCSRCPFMPWLWRSSWLMLVITSCGVVWYGNRRFECHGGAVALVDQTFCMCTYFSARRQIDDD